MTPIRLKNGAKSLRYYLVAEFISPLAPNKVKLLNDPKAKSLRYYLVAEFISPPKVYTFSFIVGNIIPKSVKCIHSATTNPDPLSPEFTNRIATNRLGSFPLKTGASRKGLRISVIEL